MRPPTMAGRLGDLADRSPIITNGALAPLMTSIAASKAFSMSVDATIAHDATMAGGASLNVGIILTVAAVDKELKGSLAREEMKKALGEK
jgi:hypothetical protein